MVKAEYDFGFGVDHMLKDLGYALDRAKEQGWTPDVAQQVYERYQKLSQNAGMGTSDTSSLLEFYRHCNDQDGLDDTCNDNTLES